MVHLGDHDPSGIDMTRDIADRMRTFGVEVEVDRVAPNPTKPSDSGAKDYPEQYGGESWELDALDPATLAGIIEEAVGRKVEEEKTHRGLLAKLPERWDDVVSLLNEQKKVPAA